MILVSAFLPTEVDPVSGKQRGFNGYTSLSVSRNDMLKVLHDICGEVLEARGARVKLRLSAPDPHFERGLSFIQLAG